MQVRVEGDEENKSSEIEEPVFVPLGCIGKSRDVQNDQS